MNYYDKSKDPSDVQYRDVNNLSVWPITQKLRINMSQRIKYTSQFNEDLIKKYSEQSEEGHFLKLMFGVLINYLKFIAIYHFYQK